MRFWIRARPSSPREQGEVFARHSSGGVRRNRRRRGRRKAKETFRRRTGRRESWVFAPLPGAPPSRRREAKNTPMSHGTAKIFESKVGLNCDYKSIQLLNYRMLK